MQKKTSLREVWKNKGLVSSVRGGHGISLHGNIERTEGDIAPKEFKDGFEALLVFAATARIFPRARRDGDAVNNFLEVTFGKEYARKIPEFPVLAVLCAL